MKNITFSLLVYILPFIAASQGYKASEPLAHTYSIVARDSATGDMAVGVQSHWFSVGTAVPWGESGVGVVATQSFVDKSYGSKGLILMKSGYSAQQALDSLLIADEGIEVRQVAMIDAKGNVAVHTGKKCIQYASDLHGNNYSVQSNMMLKDDVCEHMEKAFLSSAGKPLAERVLIALEAAEAAGGDIRGKQSAALIVVSGEKRESWNDKLIDVRVDDSEAPLSELRRLYAVYVAYEYMNKGDLAVEHNEMEIARDAYFAAMKMFPENLEMKFWTAITLANNGKINEALPLLKTVFNKDPNWKELAKRLPAVGLLTVSDQHAAEIYAQ